ncbi:MAG: hypothetical protein JOZ68_18365 [Acidimicrobiia bacterium]|nr:hypothetical protein [Acidimicrobiia bacterium]MBV9042970.1 hypothetical protein [Acidimicrobiia bacterium]
MRRVQVCKSVEDPARAVEVACQQLADVAVQQRIEARVDRASQMALDNLSSERQVLTVRSAGIRPATPNRRPPSRLSGSLVLPAERPNVISTNEQAQEQPDLALVRSGGIDVEEGLCSVVEEFRRPPRLFRRAGTFVHAEQGAETGILGPERGQLVEQVLRRRIADDR